MVEILKVLSPLLVVAFKEGLRLAFPSTDGVLRNAAAERMTAIALKALEEGDLASLLREELADVQPLDLDRELPP